MDEGAGLCVPQAPLSRGNTKLREQPEHRDSGESACLCENTRKQIVDIKILGRLWDWAISFSPRTKGPFLSHCKTETILSGLWNFWAFFPPWRRNGLHSKATDEVGCKGQDVHIWLCICLCPSALPPPPKPFAPKESSLLAAESGGAPPGTRAPPCPEPLQEAICQMHPLCKGDCSSHTHSAEDLPSVILHPVGLPSFRPQPGIQDRLPQTPYPTGVSSLQPSPRETLSTRQPPGQPSSPSIHMPLSQRGPGYTCCCFMGAVPNRAEDIFQLFLCGHVIPQFSLKMFPAPVSTGLGPAQKPPVKHTSN